MDIAAMVAKACPGSEIAEVVQRTGGQLSTVFEVRRTDADPLIVKVYAPEWAWKQAKEVHVYQLLATELGASIPRVVHAEEASASEQHNAFTVLTKLDGVPLSELEPPDWRATYTQLGQLIARVHRIPQPAYGYLTDRILDPLPDNEQYMQRQFAKKLGEFSGDPKLRTAIRTYVDQRSHLFTANHAPVLCHNDFHEGNVLVDPATWRVTGFIDVENAIAADPLMDLAKTVSYSIHDNSEKLAGLIGGYGVLPDDWADRILLYRVYHSLELWDWFASIGETTHLDGIATELAELVNA